MTKQSGNDYLDPEVVHSGDQDLTKRFANQPSLKRSQRRSISWLDKIDIYNKLSAN